MRILFLLLISIPSFAQFGAGRVSTKPVSGVKEVPPEPPDDEVQSVTTFKLVNLGSGNRYFYTRKPSGAEPTKYPVIGIYGGDGTDGSQSAIVTNQAVSCPSGVCAGNFVNPGNLKVLCGTVVVRQDGTPIAQGYEGGVLEGSGITAGVMAFNDPTGAFSFNLVSPGGTVTISYSYTLMASECGLYYINSGDGGYYDTIGMAIGGAPAIIYQVQNAANNADMGSTEYFVNAIAQIETDFPGKIDYNRIYFIGTSRGGRSLRLHMNSKPDSVDGAGFITQDYGGENFTNNSNKNKFTIMGTNDSGFGSVATTNRPWLTIGGGTNQNRYRKINAPWGVGHFGALWNTLGFDHTTSQFNWYAELMSSSSNYSVSAGLMVDKAQWSLKTEDYREALNEVNAMSAGATKTGYLSELATLKSTLDTGGRRFYIDFGPTSSTGNINNLTSCGLSATVSNLIDDAGASSGYTFTITNAFSASTTESNLNSTYANGTFWGLQKNTNIDGMTISEVGNATITGLTSGKTVTVKLYLNEVSENYTYRAGVNTTVEGASSFYDCAHNTGLIAPQTFTRTVGGDNDIDIQIQPRDSNRPVYLTSIEIFIQN